MIVRCIYRCVCIGAVSMIVYMFLSYLAVFVFFVCVCCESVLEAGNVCTSCLFLPVFLSGYLCIYLYLYGSVLEADVVADLAGGSGASLGQEKPPVGAYANLVDSLPGPGGRGAGGGLSLRQPH